MESFIEKEIGCDLHVKGYRILLKALEPLEKIGSILLPEQSGKDIQRHYNVGLVLKMGPQAYLPLEKFGGEPFCKVGDWVYYSSYERENVNINNKLCYFINDERVYAVIPDIKTVVKEL